jgi:hypothetical protein
MGFGAASFWIATSGVAPLTSFAVCAAAASANGATTIALRAPIYLMCRRWFIRLNGFMMFSLHHFGSASRGPDVGFVPARSDGATGRRPFPAAQRSDLNAALNSFAKTSGCSQAAKCPPFSTRW